ncbi:MAG: hypothetical protein JWL73_2966 [Actinomycetia bacterium]|nr:hypothetical protein [Actinomycetes bacterium]
MAKGKYSKRRDVGGTDGDATLDAEASDDTIVDLTSLDVGDAPDDRAPEPPRTTVAPRPSMTRLYKADPKGGTKARGSGRVTPAKASAQPMSKEDRRAARIEARQAARSKARPVADTHAADGARLAPIPSRGFAAIIDIVVVGILYIGISRLVGAIYGTTKNNGYKGAGNLVIVLATFVMVLLYAVPSVARTGQTLGHRILKLRVRVEGKEGPPGWAVAFRRYVLIAALPNLPTLGSLLAMFAGLSFYVFKDGRSLLDRVAKTQVIAYGPERAGSSLWGRRPGRA